MQAINIATLRARLEQTQPVIVLDVRTAANREVQRLITTYLTERDAREAIDTAELLRRLHHKTVVVLDVRPELEYRQGHIPSAVSMPLSALEEHFHTLPRDREVVRTAAVPTVYWLTRPCSSSGAMGSRCGVLARAFRSGVPLATPA